MKIRDKIIISFFVIVFLLLVSIVVKFSAIRQTYKQYAALMNGAANVDDNKERALRAEAIRRHLTGKFSGSPLMLSDTAPILLLDTCVDVRQSLRMARSGLDILETAEVPAAAKRNADDAATAIQRLLSMAVLFNARSDDDVTKAEAFTTCSAKTPKTDQVLKLLERYRSLCNQAGNVLPLKDLADKAIEQLGPVRFELRQQEHVARQAALKAIQDFAGLVATAGIPGVADLPAQLQSGCFDVLSAGSMDELRMAWGNLATAFGTVSSQVPPPNAHPMVGRLNSSLDTLQRAWNEYVRARVAEAKRDRAARGALDNFRKDGASTLVVLAQIERAVIRGLAREREGAEGMAEAFTEEVLAAVKDLPVDVLIRSETGTALSVFYEQRQWKLVYEQQLQDLTFMTILFALGVILALGLSFMVYRDVNNPVEILKNSLNNLSMGGEKRRINLKFQNEFGSLIEAYNRYLDNLTSTSKRLVECPSCRNPYEMGDSFCRQCGRKLRFDS